MGLIDWLIAGAYGVALVLSYWFGKINERTHRKHEADDMEDEDILILDFPDIGATELNDRFRVPGGRVVHRASIIEDGHDGFFVFLACETNRFSWYHDGEDQRLGLIKDPTDEVTCRGCIDRVEKAREDRGRKQRGRDE